MLLVNRIKKKIHTSPQNGGITDQLPSLPHVFTKTCTHSQTNLESSPLYHIMLHHMCFHASVWVEIPLSRLLCPYPTTLTGRKDKEDKEKRWVITQLTVDEETQERDQANVVMHVCVCVCESSFLFIYFFYASLFVTIYVVDKDKKVFNLNWNIPIALCLRMCTIGCLLL